MSRTKETNPLEHLHIRTYMPSDQPRVQHLFEAGRLSSHVMENDTAADIENIHDAYLSDPRMHFWVAMYQGQVVGMVGVACEGDNVAEIRRLRVDPSYRHKGIGAKLIEIALTFCREQDYIKVVFDTHMEEDDDAMMMFDRFAFKHNRTRSIGGKELLEFYIDLYHDPTKRGD